MSNRSLSHTPAKIQGPSHSQHCCCCCRVTLSSLSSLLVPVILSRDALKLKGDLLILVAAAVWLESSLERGHIASVLGGLKQFLPLFIIFLILLRKKCIQLAAWSADGSIPTSPFFLRGGSCLDDLLCQVLCFPWHLCLMAHEDLTLPTHLVVALVAAVVTC